MYDKVAVYWAKELRRVEGLLAKQRLEHVRDEELLARRRILVETDMAVIVSPEQNEVERMREKGLDIVRHRERMNREALDEKFKDTNNPLRLVFVCAMWLTGFDAPSCSTVYLDKPMRNHTLMQTIARANRVYPGKQSGTIVDYANVFISLERALAIYGSGSGGDRPVQDKKELAKLLETAIVEADEFCRSQGVSLAHIEAEPAGHLNKLTLIGQAVEAFIGPDETRKDFQSHERFVANLYNAVKPDPLAAKFASTVTCLATIAAEIRNKMNPDPASIAGIMTNIQLLLDGSIAGVEMAQTEVPRIDLSKIDFKALRDRFAKSDKKKTDLEVLRAAIRARLDTMIRLNPTRIDFLTKFEELIAANNSGAANIDDLFRQLLDLTKDLGEEEQRHIRENLLEEELVVFDILTRPAPGLSPEEEAEVKKVARELLLRLKALLDLDWRGRVGTRSRVQLAIEETLDEGLPKAYTKDLFDDKVTRLFEHFYEKYPDRMNNVYTAV